VSDQTAAELSEATEVPARKKRNSVQDKQVKRVRHVYELAKQGTFKGHQPAQAVMTYYAFNMAMNDSKPRGFRQGYVMPGCTYPASVANATSWSDEAVRKANAWLHEQRFIEIRDVQPDGQRSIEVLSYDAESEQARQKVLAEEGLATAPELKRGPRAKRTQRPTAETPISTDSGNPANVSGNTPPANSTEVDTDSSDSSIYISDSYIPEQPAPQARAASIESAEIENEEEREEAPAGPGRAGQVPAEDRAGAKSYTWFIECDRHGTPVSCRVAAGRGRPRGGERTFTGTLGEFQAKYPGLVSDRRKWMIHLGPGNVPQGYTEIPLEEHARDGNHHEIFTGTVDALSLPFNLRVRAVP
jgi:hypothetical protein